MKILFVASENNMYSGAFLSLVALIKILKDKYDLKCFVLLPYKGEGQKLLDENKIEYKIIRSCNWVESLNPKRKIFAFIKKNIEIIFNTIPILRIVLMCKKYHFDIIHINSTYSYVGCVAGCIVKTPIIWHLREFMEEDQGNKLWYRRAGYCVISKANAIVTISKALEEKYNKLIAGNIVTIYNGIDISKFYIERKAFKPNKIVNFVCVGGLYENKGHKTIIEAAKILIESGDRAFVIKFVGDGYYRKQLEELVRKYGLEEYIIFCGFHREVSKFYAEADVAIMSSYSEAFGRVTIEAMVAGNFVIGSNSGATTELLQNGKYGLLYECANERDLANKLHYVISNPQYRHKVALDAQKYAINQYNAEKNADNIYKLYKSVL